MEELSSLKEQLKALEERLLLPETRKSRPELEVLLADDFMEFGSSGWIYNKQQSIATMLSSTPEHLEYMQPTDFEAKLLSPEIAIVTYRSAR